MRRTAPVRRVSDLPAARILACTVRRPVACYQVATLDDMPSLFWLKHTTAIHLTAVHEHQAAQTATVGGMTRAFLCPYAPSASTAGIGQSKKVHRHS